MKIPFRQNLEKVCALVLAGTTANHLVDRSGVQPKSTVLVTGATGGVGTIVIQLLKKKHCTVICVSSHQNKWKKLKDFGADFIISPVGLVETIATKFPKGADYAIDLVGGSLWSSVIQTLGKGGTMAFCATSVSEPGSINIGIAFSKELNILGSYGGSRRDLQKIIDLYGTSQINPVIDNIYKLKDAQDALDILETQQGFGKMLLTNSN